MRIVYLSTEVEVKPKAPVKAAKQLASARRWMAIQNQRNYKSALKNFEEEIKEIQKHEPGWAPSRD